MRKKVLAVLLVFAMACCMACGSGEVGGIKEDNTKTEEVDKLNEDAGEAEAEEQDLANIADGEEQGEDDVEVEAEPEDVVAVGSTITFGNDTYSNEWIVLDQNENNILIISKYVVQQIKYNDIHEGCTWETCSLRKWLNDDYYNSAFSDEERARIQLTNVKNEDVFGRNCGEDTSDYIFVLSYEEAKTYFNSESDRKATYPDDSLAKWWLRIPGKIDFFASVVNMNGALNVDGQNVDNDNLTNVRPVMWISIQ